MNTELLCILDEIKSLVLEIHLVLLLHPRFKKQKNSSFDCFQETSKTVKKINWGELGRVTFRVEEGKKIEYQR